MLAISDNILLIRVSINSHLLPYVLSIVCYVSSFFNILFQNNVKFTMRKYYLVLIGSLILVSGCGKDDNPVEPVTTPPVQPVTSIWYGGVTYSVDSLVSWGLGHEQQEYYHNDVDYEWYIDQANTGSASNNNCGPSCVTMALKWVNKNFSKTTEDARNTYPNSGGWWYTSDIVNYLNKYSAVNSTVAFKDSLQLQDLVKNGNILILCINTQYLRYNSNQKQRLDRFYNFQGGHFIVVKGVRKIDSKLFFEIYDPNNWNMKYPDNSEKGKNRHYRPGDLTSAVSQWWNYIIVVSKNKLNKSLESSRVDINTIVDARGR